MLFLADESCDFGVVRALRAAGHDVLAVADVAQRADDSDVIQLALKEGRILLTEDKDFGQLVYASGTPMAGVILIRCPASARASVTQAVVDLVRDKGEQIINCFVVVQPG